MLIYHLALGKKWFKIFGIKSFVSVSTSLKGWLLAAVTWHIGLRDALVSEWVSE